MLTVKFGLPRTQQLYQFNIKQENQERMQKTSFTWKTLEWEKTTAPQRAER